MRCHLSDTKSYVVRKVICDWVDYAECCITVQERLKIISRSFDRAQHFEPTSHLVEENG